MHATAKRAPLPPPSMAMALLPAHPTDPNNNWHRVRRAGHRDRDRHTESERERERERESCGPPPLLLPSYSLSFSFYRVPNYVWMKRPRAKISRRRFFAVSNWLVSAMASSMRAREGKEGRKEERNEAPVEPNLTKNITINVE